MPEFVVEPVVAGRADAPALVLGEPVSFWGGIDPHTGRIVDVHHPRCGASVAGAVLVMPLGRGSSSTSSVIAEMVRLGTAPAGFVLREPDEIVALGCLVGEELYGHATPIVVASAEATGAIADGEALRIDGARLVVG